MTVERHDPLPAFCFKVMLTIVGDQRAEAYFQSVSGLTYETDVEDYREGGFNYTTRRLVGSVKWPNIVLKKGFSPKADGHRLLKWREQWVYGIGNEPVQRASGQIIQLDHKLKTVCSWEFERGWPCKWVGPELDASKDELAIESIEIAHEGLRFRP
jgi:phage tail-like protein